MITLELNVSGPATEGKGAQKNSVGQLPAILANESVKPVIQNGEPVVIKLKDGPTGSVATGTGLQPTYPDIEVSASEIEVEIVANNVPPTAGYLYFWVSLYTSGSLIVGRRYLITGFNSGDVFTNVGAASNATGQIFIATGTTPTTWTHASVLAEITQDMPADARLTPDRGAPVNALTSGILESGKTYIIQTFVAGDDFANVGAGANVSGMAFVASGPTPTDWSHGSTLREVVTIEDALNATGVIQAAGGVRLEEITPAEFYINFTEPGGRSEIGVETAYLAPGVVTVETSLVRVGVSAYSEVQKVKFVLPPVGEVSDLDELPEADGEVLIIQMGDTDVASVQRIVLDPPPVGGSFTFKIAGTFITAPATATASEIQALVGDLGGGYLVVKSDRYAWDIQCLTNGVDAEIELVTDGLIVPKGVQGTVSYDADIIEEVRRAYPDFEPVFKVHYTPTGGEQRNIFSEPAEIL